MSVGGLLSNRSVVTAASWTADDEDSAPRDARWDRADGSGDGRRKGL